MYNIPIVNILYRNHTLKTMYILNNIILQNMCMLSIDHALKLMYIYFVPKESKQETQGKLRGLHHKSDREPGGSRGIGRSSLLPSAYCLYQAGGVRPWAESIAVHYGPCQHICNHGPIYTSGFLPDSEANGRGAGVYKNRINCTAAGKKAWWRYFFKKKVQKRYKIEFSR